MFKYRVRGIYTTALSKILLDAKHKIVQATPLVTERLNLEQDNSAPDATIKDSEHSKDSIIAIGFADAVKEVTNLIQKEMPHTIVWRNRLPIRGIVRGKIKKQINDLFLVDIGSSKYEGIIKGNYKPGDLVYATIIRPPFKQHYKALLSNTIQIVGYYARVIYGRPRIIVSRHITDKKIKTELFALGMKLKEGRWGIQWRSSARFVNNSTLTDEVKSLIKKGREILEKLRSSNVPELVYESEQMNEIMIPLNSKEYLDSIRNTVTITMKGHHWAKAMGRITSAITDFVEFSKNKGIDNGIDNTLLDFVIHILSTKRFVNIFHSKITGETYELTPGKIKRIMDNEILMVRRLRKYGTYDGLGVPKSPGDYDFLKFLPKSNFLVHKYYKKNGEFIGVYININTPIEITYKGIKYIDLLVDVVCRPNDSPKVIDLQELDKAYLEERTITREMYDLINTLIPKAKQLAKQEIETYDEFANFFEKKANV